MTSVVVVDDHPVFREGVVAVLSREPGIEVVAAVARAADVGPVVERLHPDIVLLDVRLTDGDGLDLCAQIGESGNGTRVIMLTQLMTERVLTAAFDAKASGFVVKGSGGDVICRAVRAVAGGGCFVDPAIAGRMVRLATKVRRGRRPYGLTVAELRVAAFLPDGLTNRQIADALGVSTETVKSHLRSAMRRVGATDRVDLAAILSREGAI